MKKLLLSAITGATLLASVGASAAELKVGVVDLQQILQKSPQIATINDQLNKQFKPRQDKIQALQNTLQSESDNLNRNTATMSGDARNKLQDKIIADRANLESMAVAFRRDLAAAQNTDMQGFMNQLTGVINNIAKTYKYNMVLQRAGVPYVDPSMDITAQVLQGLGNSK